MSGEERRKRILQLLRASNRPISGTALAKELAVSRQVVVQDIALLRAGDMDILSTTRGYYIQEREERKRIFKVHHSNEEVEKELQLFVDLGGFVKDVFVYHKAYGVVKAELNLASRADIEDYMDNIKTGKSTLLSSVTSGYHYHTILAKEEKILDRIQRELVEQGFLAPLTDHEPVDFWKNEKESELGA